MQSRLIVERMPMNAAINKSNEDDNKTENQALAYIHVPQLLPALWAMENPQYSSLNILKNKKRY